jgi:hypothetical protein
MEVSLDATPVDPNATVKVEPAPPQPPSVVVPPPEAAPPPRARWRRPIDYYLLWLGVIVSLGINAYLLNLVIEVQRQLGTAAGDAAEAVADFSGASIDYPVEIRETIPVSLTVRYHDTISVPISYTLPINTNIAVPLRTPLGTFPLNFPVVASIPISLNPMIPISIVVPISHVVPIAIDVPIHIELADTPFGTALVGVEDYLNGVAEDLEEPTLPGLPFMPTPTPGR